MEALMQDKAQLIFSLNLLLWYVNTLYLIKRSKGAIKTFYGFLKKE